MSDIGRWGVVDPLSELQFRFGPYSYVYGNPIRFNDPTGMIGEDPDPKKMYGPKRGQPIEEVVMTYTKPSSLSFMSINNIDAYHASQDRLASAIKGSNAAPAGASVSLVPVDKIRLTAIAMGLILFNLMEI